MAEGQAGDALELLSGIVQELLGSGAPAPADLVDADLLDLGIDSLMLFRIRARVAQSMGVAVDVPTLFAAPTLRALATAVEDARR